MVGTVSQNPVTAVNYCHNRLVETRARQENRLRDVRGQRLGVLDPNWGLSGKGCTGGRGAECGNGYELYEESVDGVSETLQRK